jgi:hypothetical protein
LKVPFTLTPAKYPKDVSTHPIHNTDKLSSWQQSNSFKKKTTCTRNPTDKGQTIGPQKHDYRSAKSA